MKNSFFLINKSRVQPSHILAKRRWHDFKVNRKWALPHAVLWTCLITLMYGMNTFLAETAEFAAVIRTALGPRRRDKLIVKETGEVIITADGRTLMSEMGAQVPLGLS